MILIYILVLISLIAYYIWTYLHPYSWQKYRGDKKILALIIGMILLFIVVNWNPIGNTISDVFDYVLKGIRIQ